jgi:hypothetical protein
MALDAGSREPPHDLHLLRPRVASCALRTWLGSSLGLLMSLRPKFEGLWDLIFWTAVIAFILIVVIGLNPE